MYDCIKESQIRIGIITIAKENNYGDNLQAFALQIILNQLGYDAEIINYLFCRSKIDKSLKPLFKVPIKQKIIEYLKRQYLSLEKLLYKGRNRRRQLAFQIFHEKYTKFSGNTYRNYSELQHNPPIYDVYCVGSNLVWNPYYFSSLNPYFLSFAPTTAKKISYATSFGVQELPAEAAKTYQKNLKSFDYILVHDKADSIIVESVTGKDAPIVLNPVFLLSKYKWQKIAKHSFVPKVPYLLICDNQKSKKLLNEAIRIAKERFLVLVRISSSEIRSASKGDEIKDIWSAGPSDYVGLIENASLVITNSFHGTAFSIIMERNFYTILPNYTKQFFELKSLLRVFDLNDHLLCEGNHIKFSFINYNSITSKLDKMRNMSLSLLINAIDKN